MRSSNSRTLPVRVAPALLLALGLAMLLWMKLRLTTGVPRAVYAEPPAPSTPEQKPSAH